MTSAPPFRFCPRVLELGDVELSAALSLLREREQPVLLESARGEPRRWSWLAFDPLPPRARPEGELLGLRELHAQLGADGTGGRGGRGDPVPGPFHGGLLAALAYDLGVARERPVRCPPEPWGLPLLVGGLYTDFLVRDEAARRTWLVLGEDPGDGRPSVRERLEDVARALAAVPSSSELRAGPLVRHTPPEEHMRRVERARELIAQGEIYQANLAHRFTCAASGSPVDWFLRLLSVNPAPYMGFLGWGSTSLAAPGAILSASPELLLEFDGERARTRPIKGTIARAEDATEDQRRRERLLASEKDRAELAMIVDLERNDFGRIARPGGVAVEAWPRLESYARVHHLMADVVAQPREGVDAFDMLAAVFPGGSITGAPKLRAMEAIAELEGEGRGFFTGSLGFVDTRGRCSFNILIRTLLWRPELGGELSFRVGGGITWSSDPAAEERETLDKASALVETLALAAP
jgi:para-aminobenzoate synthetase component I